MTNKHSQNRRGIVLVLAAACLILILAFAAFTVDVGYILVTKAQLQSTTDSAVLAATQVLSTSPEKGKAAVIAAAEAVVNSQASGVGDGHLKLVSGEDILIGTWDDETHKFVEITGNDISKATAVSLTLRLNKGRKNALPLFFAPILGQNTADLKSTAISAVEHDQPRDVVLVIDCSKSMEDHKRMSLTHDGALLLCDQLNEQDRLGLAVYSYPVTTKTKKGKKTTTTTTLTGFLENALSLDHSPVKARVPKLDPGEYADNTNIGGGMRIGIEELVNNPRQEKTKEPVVPIMIVMTDGHANVAEAPESDPTKSISYYANLAKQKGIIVHGVTLGSEADAKSIEAAAKLTGGIYRHVPEENLDQMLKAFKDIGLEGGSAKLVK